MKEKITNSSGNVFADFGFEAEEAENLRIRADLMIAIKQYITEQGLTQVEAANKFGVAQPRISEIFQGKIEQFTIDRLINMLAHVGKHIDIKIKNKAA